MYLARPVYFVKERGAVPHMKKDSFLEKLIFGYDKLEEWILCGSLVLTTLIITTQIIMRNIGQALIWSEELTRYIFVWQIWLGVSIAQKDKAHINVEIIKSFVKNKTVLAIISIIATLIWIIFNIFLVGAGFELVQQMITRGNVSSALRLPMYLVYVSLPISSAILTLRLLGKLKNDVLALAGKNNEEVE